MAGKLTLTPQIKKTICASLAEGNTVLTACGAAGISSRTFHDWMQSGERGETRPLAIFHAAVSRARAKCKAMLVRRIVAAAEHDWRAAAWKLERLFPREYGPTAPRQPDAEEANGIAVKIIYDTGGKSMRELLDFPIIGELYPKPGEGDADDDLLPAPETPQDEV